MTTTYRSGNKGTNWESMSPEQLKARLLHYDNLLATYNDPYWLERCKSEKWELTHYCELNKISLA